MEPYRPIRIFLCLYESVRLVFLVWAFVQVQPVGATPFPLITLITPGALFFLMALFWLLDMRRYTAFGPLFLVGKGLGIITTLFWIFAVDIYIIEELRTVADWFFETGFIFFLVLGDMLSVGLVTKIVRQ